MYIEIFNVNLCLLVLYVLYISLVKIGRVKYLFGFIKVEDKCNIIEEGYVLFRFI